MSNPGPVISVVRSHKGLIRKRNEDAVLHDHEGTRFVVAVADGLGGHNAGEVASELVRSHLQAVWREVNGADGIEKMIETLHHEIIAAGNADPDRLEMATTLSMIVGDGDGFILGHVGDSRAYLFGEKGLRQISKDQTVAQDLFDTGALTKEELQTHPSRHRLTQALGVSGPPPCPQIVNEKWSPGDIILMCSDGLSEMVSDDLIADTLASAADLEQAADNLLALALDAGGRDNVTLALARHC